MNIWNVSFALLVAISIIIISVTTIGSDWGFIVGLPLSAFLFLILIVYFSKYKVNLSPVHLVAGFGILFLALFGSVYKATFEVPIDWRKHPIGEPWYKLLSLLGVPDEWLFLPAILYLFVVPLIGILGIVEGVMGVFKDIFGEKWTHVIAICISFITIPFGIFTRIVQSMFSAMGLYSVGAFAFLFIFAVISKVFEGLKRMQFVGAKTLKGVVAEMEAEATYTEMRSEAEEVAKSLISAGRTEGGEKGAEKIRAGGRLLDAIAKADTEAKKGGYKKAIQTLADSLKKFGKETQKS